MALNDCSVDRIMGKRKRKDEREVEEVDDAQASKIEAVVEDLELAANESDGGADDDAPESVSFAQGREDVHVEARKQAESRKLYVKKFLSFQREI